MSEAKDEKVFLAKCGCLIKNKLGVVDLFPCKESCEFGNFVISYMSGKNVPVVDVYDEESF